MAVSARAPWTACNSRKALRPSASGRNVDPSWSLHSIGSSIILQVLLAGPGQDLDIKRKAVEDAGFEERAGRIPAKELEPALRIGDRTRQPARHGVEDQTADPAEEGLRLEILDACGPPRADDHIPTGAQQIDPGDHRRGWRRKVGIAIAHEGGGRNTECRLAPPHLFPWCGS